MESRHLSFKRQRSSTSVEVSREVDYISTLPDDILIQIIGKLPFDEAFRTSLISQRWIGLWRHKRQIEIGCEWFHKIGRMALPMLFQILNAYHVNRIESISLSFSPERSTLTDVLYLLGFAILGNVRELNIEFDDKYIYRIGRRREYRSVVISESNLPPCSSLVKKLSLRYAKLETFPRFRFSGLEQLFLVQVKLGDNLVEQVTENCPSLTLLTLINCNPSTDLRIITSVNSKHLHLVIEEEFVQISPKTCIYIKGASFKSIEFLLALPRKGYQIEGIRDCLESATFKLNQMHQSSQAKLKTKGIAGKFATNFSGMLRKLKTAKVITLSSWCIQVLSIEALELRAPPICNATHLVLQTGMTKLEFSGICHVLECCSKIRNLLIIMSGPAELHLQSMEECHFIKDNGPVHNDLQDLAVVEFRTYGREYTWKGDRFDAHSFFSGFEYGRLLYWNLQRYAKNLRKFVFRTRRQVCETNEFNAVGTWTYITS